MITHKDVISIIDTMITYREAKTDDIFILQHLNQEVFVDNQKYDNDLVMDWTLSEKGKEYFKKLLTNPQAYCLIAEESGKPIGYIAAQPKDFSYKKSKYIEINDMGVIPGYRSGGIGSTLMQKCLTWAKNCGCKKAYVNAYFKNTPGIAFYEKNGFYKVDVSLERGI